MAVIVGYFTELGNFDNQIRGELGSCPFPIPDLA